MTASPCPLSRTRLALLVLGAALLPAACAGPQRVAHLEAEAAAAERRADALAARVAALESDVVRLQARIRTGVIVAGPHGFGFAGEPKWVRLTFDPPFAEPPHLFFTAMDERGEGYPDTFAISLREVSTGHAVIKLQRADKGPQDNWWRQQLYVHWLAYEPAAE